MFKDSTTIAAISTPPGTGGIGIVRLSGSKAMEIAAKVFTKDISMMSSHTAKFGKFVDPIDGEVIDEGLVLVMRAPNTYTREDVVEFHCHGSSITTRLLLEALVKSGASIAERGEFTKRAFLNGRIDLTQAEAVMDLIGSKTELSKNAAINQLEGHISKRVKGLRDRLISMLAHIEAYIDFPEDDIDDVTRANIKNDAIDIKAELDYLLKTFETGRIVREGLSVAIVGRTNVGKSSFLNEMLSVNKAIVTDIEGTTRDVIEDYIDIEGLTVKIIDTAGIRSTEDIVEKIGIERSKKAVEEAQIVIIILDISSTVSEDDKKIMELAGSKNCIVILNKTDKEWILTEDEVQKFIVPFKIIKASMVSGEGISEVKKTISEIFNTSFTQLDDDIITNVRHKDAIARAKIAIERFIEAIEALMPEDIIAIDLKKAVDELGIIIGEVVTEDILNEVFSKFCIGK